MRTLAIALSTLLLAACAKPIPTAKAAYVGHWQSQDVSLQIGADGRVRYRRKEGDSIRTLTAPLQEFDGNDFKVGIGPLATTFVVSAPPHADGAAMKMTVDGVELTRQP